MTNRYKPLINHIADICMNKTVNDIKDAPNPMTSDFSNANNLNPVKLKRYD